MDINLSASSPAGSQALRSLADFRGSPEEYWALFVRRAQEMLGADLVALFMISSGSGAPTTRFISSAPSFPADGVLTPSQCVAEQVLQSARAQGVAIGPALGGPWRVGLAFQSLEPGQPELVVLAHLGAMAVPDEKALEILSALRMAPLAYKAVRAKLVSDRDALRLAQSLELVGKVLEKDHFDSAALAFVNQIAETFACETVSLSWRHKEGLKVRAISHAEKIDRRTELSALLEEAGQECISQKSELVWPSKGKLVTKAHQRYAELQQPGNLLSLPLIVENPSPGMPTDGGLGVVTLERRRLAFTLAEQWAIRLLCDMALRPLALHEHRAKPLYIRLWSEIWRTLPDKIKPVTEEGRRFSKRLLAALGVSLLVPIPYYVDSGAVVMTDSMAFVGAPFDGYIESSSVSLGATVKTGDSLFSLSIRELLLERAAALADLSQYTRDAQKRRSAGQLTEMQIAEAQAAQATARLSQIEYRLENANAKSPIDGVVVEGEPAKNIGGAVRRGDMVVKVAAIADLYVEASVSERDISRIETGSSAKLMLLADPSKTYSTRVTRIIPSAAVKEGVNTLPVRLELAESHDDWWRPGMSGVVKISAGWRPLIWIASHRFVDFLRLKLWF